MSEYSFSHDQHAFIFESMFECPPRVTRWSITDLDTGEIFKNGEACAQALGVTGGAVNNCLNGRQKTCHGHRLARTIKFRRDMLMELNDICQENETDMLSVFEEFRTTTAL